MPKVPSGSRHPEGVRLREASCSRTHALADLSNDYAVSVPYAYAMLEAPMYILVDREGKESCATDSSGSGILI